MQEFKQEDFEYKTKRKFRGLPDNKPKINIILFVLTILSTTLTLGPWYSFTIITILLAHEMGHYLMCRLYRVPATLPFFIPFPFLNPFGTMGAVIQMRGMMPNRKALFDIGAAGPFASFVLSVPAIFIGMQFSEIVPKIASDHAGMILGESLMFKVVSALALGRNPADVDILLHPVAYAGWAGLFVTALNLLPIGQLDGGHILYSVFGQKSKFIYYGFLAALGILCIIYPGWILLFVLLLFFGRKHPPPLNDYIRLDRKRKIFAAIILFIFISSFTPVPFKFQM